MQFELASPIRDCVRALLATSGVYASQAVPAQWVHGFLAEMRKAHVPVELLRLGGNGDGGYLIPDDLQAPIEDRDTILQTDTEGWGYPAILSTPIDLLRRFRLIVVEFHHLDALLDPVGHLVISESLRRLLGDFAIVHIHPNNSSRVAELGEYAIPSAMECTFLRQDRLSAFARTKGEFPHRLDRRCDPSRPELILPCAWRPE